MKKYSVTVFFFITALYTILFAGGNTMLLDTGSKAPDFTMMSSGGDTVHLSDFAGKSNVVLIFYPGDETPGCTKQLCTVRDDYKNYEANIVKVFGVNPGNSESHKKFIVNHGFQFPLLIDENQKVAKLYGCSGWPMVNRTVYAIDKKGIIVFAQRGMPTTKAILQAITDSNVP